MRTEMVISKLQVSSNISSSSNLPPPPCETELIAADRVNMFGVSHRVCAGNWLAFLNLSKLDVKDAICNKFQMLGVSTETCAIGQIFEDRILSIPNLMW